LQTIKNRVRFNQDRPNIRGEDLGGKGKSDIKGRKLLSKKKRVKAIAVDPK